MSLYSWLCSKIDQYYIARAAIAKVVATCYEQLSHFKTIYLGSHDTRNTIGTTVNGAGVSRKQWILFFLFLISVIALEIRVRTYVVVYILLTWSVCCTIDTEYMLLLTAASTLFYSFPFASEGGKNFSKVCRLFRV